MRASPSALCRVAPVTEVEHVIEAVEAQAHLRALLELEPGEPCLLLHRITWVQQVVATKNRFFYPATRYRIGGRFRPSTCAQDGLV